MMMKNYNFFHSIHLLFWYICQTFFVVVAVHDWMNESWLKLNSLWNEWRLTEWMNEWMNETYKYSWHEYSLSLMNDNDDSDDDARIRFLRIQQLEFRFFFGVYVLWISNQIKWNDDDNDGLCGLCDSVNIRTKQELTRVCLSNFILIQWNPVLSVSIIIFYLMKQKWRQNN